MFDQFRESAKETIKEAVQEEARAPIAAAEEPVDLFPALADKRLMSINAIRQPVATKAGTQISVFTPVTFDEALDIVECLRARAATTVTLDNMKKHDASRLVDFVAGASAALSGNFHKLSEQVYVFCPSNIKISSPTKTLAAPSGSHMSSLDFIYTSDRSPTKSWLSSSWTSN
jgi:cell division inhibitor SepF